MSVETVAISEKAVVELLDGVADVAVNNGVGHGKEGLLILLGMAAGQISAEIEIESGSNSSDTVECLLSAVRAGIYKSRQAAGVKGSIPLGMKFH